MKKYLLILLLVSFSGIAQSINNYKYVIVPVKFEDFKENQYRLNTIAKMKLNELGFVAFYDSEIIPSNVNKDKCNFLYLNLENGKGLLSFKLFLTFKDCQNNLIFKSEAGNSKKKEYNQGFQEALQNAFRTMDYQYEGTLQTSQPNKIVSNTVEKQVVPEPTILQPSGKLTAEATSSGFLLIDDASSKIVLRLIKTSDPKTFIASRQAQQGVLIQKESEWFFEYYQNDKMVSEKIDVKF